MGDRERDQAIVSDLHTIAARTWNEPTGPDRNARLTELTAAAGGRTDLMIEAAGVLLGVRPRNEYDPRHVKCTYAARLLLELADVAEDTPEVREWVAVGAERRARWLQPADRGGLA
jgi:nitroreductase